MESIRRISKPKPNAYLLMLALGVFSVAMAAPPTWVAYPCEDWETITPQQAGITNVKAWNNWVAEKKASLRGYTFKGDVHGKGQWGVVVTRGGYLLQEFGDGDYKFQTASVGKCFTMAVLQLALDKGVIKSEWEPVKKYWTGEGQLNSPHKYMDRGHQQYVTFGHLQHHTAGHPLTNGHTWKHDCKNYNKPAPEWATCTNNPDYDNYSHAKPPASKVYSSGGYWRLGQALTAVWKKDMKDVLDEHLFSKMGIRSEDWEWTHGKAVRDNRNWYPGMPDYGLMLDPPYIINGDTVRGAPGWIVMSAKSLARFSLLVATKGYWRGEKIIGTKYLSSHSGGNGSDAYGDRSGTYYAIGQVCATPRANLKGGVFADRPTNLFTGPVKKTTTFPTCTLSSKPPAISSPRATQIRSMASHAILPDGNIRVMLSGHEAIDQASLYDIQGRMVWSFRKAEIHQEGGNSYVLQTQELRSRGAPAGVCVLRVGTNPSMIHRRIVMLP